MKKKKSIKPVFEAVRINVGGHVWRAHWIDAEKP
jgi:hypothetical protein